MYVRMYWVFLLVEKEAGFPLDHPRRLCGDVGPVCAEVMWVEVYIVRMKTG